MQLANGKNQYFGRDLEAMSFADNYHRWILDEFNEYVGRHLIEVGAGTGNFSRFLLEKDLDTLIAIEPSDNMYPLLVNSLKSNSNTQTMNEVFRDARKLLTEQPDTIFYVNVLEHISDDKIELEYVYQSLRKDGHVCIFVPALQWLYGTADANVDHQRRYYKKSLEKLVQGAGFEIVKSRYFDIAGIIPWWILFCLLKREAVRAGQVSLYDKVVVPFMRVIEQRIPIPIGKNLLVVGKK